MSDSSVSGRGGEVGRISFMKRAKAAHAEDVDRQLPLIEDSWTRMPASKAS
jgi:hypothetical protein